MSGTYPSTPAPAAVTIESFEPSYKTTAHSLRRIVRSRGAQRWMFVLKYTRLTRAEWATLFSWLMTQGGEGGSFTFYPPVFGDVQGTAAGSPKVKTTTAAGQTSIPSKGWTAGSAVLKAGDFVKFASHAKVYMVTADVTADGSGEASIPIRPILVESVTGDEVITASAVPFTVSIDQDTLEAELTPGQIVQQAEIHLIEVP